MFWGVIGLAGSVIALFLSFFPPSQISVGSPRVWVALLIIGTLLNIVIPYVIYSARKKEWKDKDSDFEVFSYEK